MSLEQDEIAERTRTMLAETYAEALEVEDAQRPEHVSAPDMHVAMLEGASRFVADVILAGRDAGGDLARKYVAEWIIERVTAQVDMTLNGRMQ